MIKGRPTKQKQKIIAERNKLIIIGVQDGFNQSEVAEMFRLPRNTVNTVVKKNFEEFKNNVLHKHAKAL